MNKKQFTVKITPDPDGGYVGRCLELPAAMSQAETKEQLLENMKEAIQLVLETIDETSKEDEKAIVEIPS
jgi:predicted RNase H-like HicB family nuclease